MKYLIIVSGQNLRVPLNCDGKMIYFDHKEDAEELIDNSYLSIKKDTLEIIDIELSRINGDEYIYYKEAVKRLGWI